MDLRREFEAAAEFGRATLLKTRDRYRELSLVKQIAVVVFALIWLIAGIFAVIYHKRILEKAVDMADVWVGWGIKGQAILFALVFVVGFPPVIGYSFLSVLCGMVYGFHGWPLLTSATLAGSSASFLVCKNWLREYSEWCIRHEPKIGVFVSALNDEEATYWQNFGVMCLVRLCPLPYSLSNGALAAIPTLGFSTFAGATFVTSPKLLVPLYVGYQLRKLAQDGEATETKLVDILNMVIAPVAFVIVTYVIYKRMSRKFETQQNSLVLELDSENA
ncbi:hypothetical protein OGAPHI_001907 [Ogataea philodendri]|uniref:Golgi apparatus membrane protein TVP38 n=1 Tax=Ogataea philodendri TaxID=1378263 RepID=A0A9P8P9E7_9ASCO|nr:uncharacterized protein OGAPHI_001907 [Ogataea philodendri]KAH3668153.1 hypothetical protein OGAPHI_001907 [Ogataea philodendri]